jgi:hypothetical protein
VFVLKIQQREVGVWKVARTATVRGSRTALRAQRLQSREAEECSLEFLARAARDLQSQEIQMSTRKLKIDEANTIYILREQVLSQFFFRSTRVMARAGDDLRSNELDFKRVSIPGGGVGMTNPVSFSLI